MEPLYYWLILALILASAEMLTGAMYALILAGAAALTALVAASGAGETWQIGFFSILSIVLCWGLHTLKARGIIKPKAASQELNNPTNALINARGIVHVAIENGEGTVSLNDTFWQATGPDLGKGVAVKVTGLYNGKLSVLADSDSGH